MRWSLRDIPAKESAPKKWKPLTRSGYSIIHFVGPDSLGAYAGIIAIGEGVRGCTWDVHGVCLGAYPDFDLVAFEPEVTVKRVHVFVASGVANIDVTCIDGKPIRAELVK